MPSPNPTVFRILTEVSAAVTTVVLTTLLTPIFSYAPNDDIIIAAARKHAENLIFLFIEYSSIINKFLYTFTNS